MNSTFSEDLNAELLNLAAQRDAEIASASRLLVTDRASIHLGHNLGNKAIEIARITGKIEAIEMVLRSEK